MSAPVLSIGGHDLTGLWLDYVEAELTLKHGLGMPEAEALAVMNAARADAPVIARGYRVERQYGARYRFTLAQS